MGYITTLSVMYIITLLLRWLLAVVSSPYRRLYRSLWAETRNMATDNPQVAWRIMEATAMQQDRLKDEAGIKKTGRKSAEVVMTYSLAWHPDENEELTKVEMVKAANDIPRRIGRTKGGLNSKLHAVCDGNGRPLILCLTEGQMSDHIGAKLTYPALPSHACLMIGDKGYDSDEYRAALKAKNITPCIPPRKGRILTASFDKTLYRKRHKIENMFGRLKDWRRVATRYDRCAHTFFSAICIAAIVIWWI